MTTQLPLPLWVGGPPPLFRLQVVDAPGPRKTVAVLNRSGRWLWWVEAKGVHAHARYQHDLEGDRLFLRMHWDSFVDAGWEMDAWFLIGCRVCGADSFEGCRHKVTGEPIKYIHKGRVP